MTYPLLAEIVTLPTFVTSPSSRCASAGAPGLWAGIEFLSVQAVSAKRYRDRGSSG